MIYNFCYLTSVNAANLEEFPPILLNLSSLKISKNDNKILLESCKTDNWTR